MISTIYSKLAAIGILLLLTASSWFLLGEPYLDTWQDKILQAERLQRKIDSLRLLIGDRERYDQQLLTLSNSEALQHVFLDDKSGALAEVKLQRIVRQIVSNSGARVIQATIINNKSNTDARDKSGSESRENKTVTIKVLMQGSIKSIYSALHELENNRPLILVDNLEIVFKKSRYQVAGSTNPSIYAARYDATAFIL